jgi:hypothetical protein
VTTITTTTMTVDIIPDQTPDTKPDTAPRARRRQPRRHERPKRAYETRRKRNPGDRSRQQFRKPDESQQTPCMLNDPDSEAFEASSTENQRRTPTTRKSYRGPVGSASPASATQHRVTANAYHSLFVPQNAHPQKTTGEYMYSILADRSDSGGDCRRALAVIGPSSGRRSHMASLHSVPSFPTWCPCHGRGRVRRQSWRGAARRDSRRTDVNLGSHFI